MTNKQIFSKIWLGWSITFSICTLVVLFVSFATNEASASSIELASSNQISSLNLQVTDPPTSTLQVEPTANDDPPSPALQLTDPLTSSVQVGATPVYTFSLTALGYEERTLNSPQGGAQYVFRIPESWSIQSEGLLNLDLSYAYTQVDDADSYPAFFGDLTVRLDGQTLEVFQIDEREFNHRQLQISLPTSLLADSDRVQHVIELLFDAQLICEIPHKASLVVHPNSSVFLNYNKRPLIPDLARYPQPFFQRAFDPDSVRFVLPSQPTTADLTSASAVAAKLGDLTGNQLVISATTDLNLNNSLSSPDATFDEHLVLVGQPQDNQLLPVLNEVTELPVSLHERQVELVTQGPAAIAPGDIFTYDITITNTLDQVVNLSLINPLPFYTEFIDCSSDCLQNASDNSVTWLSDPLAPDEVLSFSLTLRATDILTGSVLENTITLVEADLGAVNADTFVSSVVANSSDSKLQTSVADQSDYFFVYQERAVAAGDGIVQEVLSPWSNSRAILIITGLSDEAVRKASQAMSSEARFPGMSGQVALVRDALSPSEINDTASTAVEMTFEDLGYEDRLIYGGNIQSRYYKFEIPYGWRLTDDAFVDLYFSHSQLIEFEDSGVSVLVNKQPTVSIPLSEKTAGNGQVRVNLGEANVRTTDSNEFRVETDMALPAEECGGQASEQAWFLIKKSSKFFLAHEEAIELNFDLTHFPSPFYTDRALTDLLLTLPDDPTDNELEMTLRLAASLGSAAAGKTLVPVATIGNELPTEDLTNFHIIAIGRPSRNALIQQVNDLLPQPFLPGSDEIEQRLDDVVFRLPINADLGYIQLIPSPWNESRAFLAVTGASNEGVKAAADTLSGKSWVLNGNLALIRGDEVNTIDTRELIRDGVARVIATAVPEITSVVTTTTLVTTPQPQFNATPNLVSAEQDSATPPSSNRPTWLMPLVGINGLVVLCIFAFAIWQSRRK